MIAFPETLSALSDVDMITPRPPLRPYAPTELVKAILETRAVDLRITPEVEMRIDRDSDLADAVMAVLVHLHRITDDTCTFPDETAGRLLSTLTRLRHTLHVRIHATVAPDPGTASGRRLELLLSTEEKPLSGYI